MNEVGSPEAIRVLKFVDAASTFGVGAASEHIDAYAALRPPELTWEGMGRRYHSAFPPVFDPPMSRYLERIGWIKDESRIGLFFTITPLGTSVLAYHAEADELDDNKRDFAITMQPDSELDYIRFLAHLSGMSDALVIDRYASVSAVIQVANLLAVTRVLTGAKKTRTDESADSRASLLESSLGALNQGAEVRTLDVNPSPLHDRLVLPGEGRGLLLGGSLGGTQVNAVVTLSEGMTSELRATYETHWQSAIVVEPKVVSVEPHEPNEAIKAAE